MSTLYGSDAMGGVINIITRKVSQEWMGQITLDGTAQGDNRYGNNYGSAFYLSGPIATDKLGLTVRGGLYRRLSANGSYPVNQAEYNSGNYTGDIAGFSGLGDSLQRNLGLRLALTPNRNHDILFDIDSNWQVFDNANGELGTLNSSVARNRQGGGYEPDALQPPALRADASGPLRRLGQLRHQPGVRHHRDYRPDQSHERAASADRRRQARPGIRQLGLRHQVDHAVVQRAPQLTMGGQWREQKFKDTLVSAPLNLSQYQWALFAENEWRIVDDLALTLGARYDRNEQFGGKWSPRGYLVWNATPAWTFKGGVSRATRRRTST